MKVGGAGFPHKNAAPRKTGLILSFFAHEMIKKIVQIFIQSIH